MPTKAVSARRLDFLQHVALVTGAVLVLAAILLSGHAKAADLVVVYDQSQLLRLPRPVSSVIIGNPSIADVEIHGGNLLVVTGKTFGVTNIIALDDQRNIIQDQRIVVSRDQVSTVNLSKGSERESYSCTPNCSPTLTIGDDEQYFAKISGHAQTKTKFSGAAGGGSDQQ